MHDRTTNDFLKNPNSYPLLYLLKSGGLAKLTLSCGKVLRFLPGKRVVCQADYAGQKVLVKIFFGKGYQRRWQREVDGVGFISRAGVKTPHLIESLDDKAQGFALAIFDFIEAAETLEAVWQKSGSDDVKQVLFKQALVPIALLHDCCVYQQDAHLNNFLVRDKEIFLIDGDQVLFKQEPPVLALKMAIDNLALFFTQLYPWEDEKIEPLFDYYCSLRPSVRDGMSLQVVIRQLKKRRLWREKKFLEKKIFRVCSDFDVIKNWSHYCLFSREISAEAARGFMNDPDRFIEEGEILKSGRTATVAKISFVGKVYVVKRYNKKSNFHRLARSLKESRAVVSWRNGHLLKFNGLPTAEPILMFEKRFGKMRFGSYIITEYIPGEHAANYFSRDDRSGEAKEMAEKVANLVGKLHKSGISHGDLKSHNIWIAENRPILIDLDGMRRNKSEKQHERLVKEDWLRLYRDLGNSGVASMLFSEEKGLYV